MSKIVFLAHDGSAFQKAHEAFQDTHSDIKIEKATLLTYVDIVKNLIKTGTEIFIGRLGFFRAIKSAGIETSFIITPITDYDFIQAIETAQSRGGRHIGLITRPSVLSLFGRASYLGKIMGVDIRIYPFPPETEDENVMHAAFRDGIDIVLCGINGRQIARKYNYPHVLVDNSIDDFLQAAQEAKRIEHARDMEKAKTDLLRAILEHTYEAMVSVDGGNRITFFNSVAERITGISSDKAQGKTISEIWPELKEDEMQGNQETLGQILSINGADVLCNKVAINPNNGNSEAIIIFQDIQRIRQIDARVKQHVFESGHVANFHFQDIEKLSLSLAETIKTAKDFSLTHSPILLVGETGTGKEVFAQSIHNYSPRNQGPFVAINCAALPGQILESELFGYVGGAFTSASPKGKPGLFEVAHGGTILLDEIAEMDYATQGKLLRVLQEKKLMRLGSDRVISTDVRVIAATSKDLEQLIAENKFRTDLYYRLNVLQLQLPPLRSRKEDISLLARQFLSEHAGVIKRRLTLSPAAIKALADYPWPGNIRELKNVMERIVAVHKQKTIDADTVNRMLKKQHGDQHPTAVPPELQRINKALALANVKYKESIERVSAIYKQEATEADTINRMQKGQYDDQQMSAAIPQELKRINKALALANGKYTDAAEILGVSRITLWRKLKHYGVKPLKGRYIPPQA